MKILTNIQTSQLGGIGQTLNNLITSLEKSNVDKVEIVGVEVVSEPNCSTEGIRFDVSPSSVLKVVTIGVETPYFGDVIKTVKNIDGIRDSYSDLINSYVTVIKKEKPDLILINGTYFVPWCLFQAGNQTGTSMVLHYHGILSKETSHYAPELRDLIKEMEKTFDNDHLFYIFPSELAKTIVENDVFGHPISRTAVIPNSIPDHFFNIKNRGPKKDIAFVGRWSAIKNPEFIKKISQYDDRNSGDHEFNVVSDISTAQKNIGRNHSNINFFEPMDSLDLASFYEKMGMVISPSYFETYGNVAQESIATGTPALVGPNMGIAQTFRDLGLSRYIVDFKSTKNVYDKISTFSGELVSNEVRQELQSSLTPLAINKRLVKALKSA